MNLKIDSSSGSKNIVVYINHMTVDASGVHVKHSPVHKVLSWLGLKPTEKQIAKAFEEQCLLPQEPEQSNG